MLFEPSAYLLDLKTVRSTCKQLFDLAQQNALLHFSYHPLALASCLAYIEEEIEANYPYGNIPLHSRFRHINCGEKDRISALCAKISDDEERLLALLEFVIVSVLLDAGAGANWKYQALGESYTMQRSEGLALASYDMFCSGFFAEPSELKVYQRRLRQISAQDLQSALQVSATNPLVGLEGRALLLRRLGDVLEKKGLLRLADLFSPILQMQDKRVDLTKLFHLLVKELGVIWPQGYMLQEVNLGDIGYHSAVKAEHPSCMGLVPFHKLSQWLTYSLIEPLELYGYSTMYVAELTALPEYRNGGLLLDFGVLQVKDSKAYEIEHLPHSEFVTEWRALTISILDLVFLKLKEQRNSKITTLSQVLQGGTWSAGRKIAKSKRKDGVPPLKIKSDGTVF